MVGESSAAGAKHIHLIGICGTAMASLAGMLQEQGHRITGSDAAAYPPMSDQLLAMGITPMQPYNAVHLEPAPDLVVIGNAISRGNVELEAVLDRRLPFTSMAALIHDEFLRGREPLVVSGTHGKTTTTSMLAWIYEVAAKKNAAFAPSFLIGGVAENFGTSFRVRASKPFILEGDEYDTAFFDKGPKFLHYFPDAAILTHVEFDHADIYVDLAAVKTAFKRLVNLIPQRGRLIAYDGSANVTECVAKAFCPVERYGFKDDSYWQVTKFEAGAVSHWTLLKQGEHFADLELPMAGEHNALNATAAAAMAAGQGVDAASIAEALQTFRSVKRRLEVRAEVGGITVIDDFAHHPTAIRETLRALRGSYAGRRLVAVLEPRSNTLRRNVFQDELVASLALADEVVLAAVYQSGNIPADERLHPEEVVAELNTAGVPAQLLADADAIVAALAPTLRSGDVIAILSNGGFGDIYTKLPLHWSLADVAAFKMVLAFAGLGIPAGLVLIPWTLITGKIEPMYKVGKWIARVGIRAAGIRIEASGLENIPTDRACLFVPNHVSNLDPPIVTGLLPGTPSIMLKAELLKIPVLGRAWRIAKYVPVEREGGREAAVRSARYAAEVVNSGLSMLIFAEGTRAKNGRLQAFKAGPFHLAQSTGAPIVPVVLAGTETMMRKGSSKVYPGVARVQFLPAVDPAQYATRKALIDAVRSEMIAALPESMRPLPSEADAI